MPDVRMPNGTVIRNVPAGTTKAQLLGKLGNNGFDVAQLTTPAEAPSPIENIPVIGGALSAVTDIPLAFGSGLATIGKTFTDQFGASNAASDALEGFAKGADRLRSAEARTDSATDAREMAEAKGFFESAGAAGKAFIRHPLDTTANLLGTAAPFVAAGVAATAAAPFTGGASYLPLAAMAGLGTASGVGMIKGDIYEATLARAKQDGLSDKKAEEIADEAQSYGGKNLDMIALGGIIGAAASATGAAPALGKVIAGKVLKDVAARAAARAAETAAKVAAARAAGAEVTVGAGKGLIRRGVEGALVEGVPEGTQAGQEALAENLAQDRAGFPTDPMKGVLSRAGYEGTLGAILGGGINVVTGGGGRAEAPPATEEENIPPPPGGPPATPDERQAAVAARAAEMRALGLSEENARAYAEDERTKIEAATSTPTPTPTPIGEPDVVAPAGTAAQVDPLTIPIYEAPNMKERKVAARVVVNQTIDAIPEYQNVAVPAKVVNQAATQMAQAAARKEPFVPIDIVRSVLVANNIATNPEVAPVAAPVEAAPVEAAPVEAAPVAAPEVVAAPEAAPVAAAPVAAPEVVAAPQAAPVAAAPIIPPIDTVSPQAKINADLAPAPAPEVAASPIIEEAPTPEPYTIETAINEHVRRIVEQDTSPNLELDEFSAVSNNAKAINAGLIKRQNETAPVEAAPVEAAPLKVVNGNKIKKTPDGGTNHIVELSDGTTVSMFRDVDQFGLHNPVWYVEDPLAVKQTSTNYQGGIGSTKQEALKNVAAHVAQNRAPVAAAPEEDLRPALDSTRPEVPGAPQRAAPQRAVPPVTASVTELKPSFLETMTPEDRQVFRQSKEAYEAAGVTSGTQAGYEIPTYTNKLFREGVNSVTQGKAIPTRQQLEEVAGPFNADYFDMGVAAGQEQVARAQKKKFLARMKKTPGKTARQKLFAIMAEDQAEDLKNNPPEDTSELDPQAEEIEGRAGLNKKRLLEAQKAKYRGDPYEMTGVVAKELLQNSHDATRTAMENGQITQGKVSFDVNDRTIIIRDNGIGMSGDLLAGPFLELGSTGKGTGTGQNSGGFGLAKALLLYGSAKIDVITASDGKISTLDTTGEALAAAAIDEGPQPRIKVRDFTFDDFAMFPEGHGSIVQLLMPEKEVSPYGPDLVTVKQLPDKYNNYNSLLNGLRDSPLFANTIVTYNGDTVPVGANFPLQDYRVFGRVKLPYGVAHVYVSKEKATPRFNTHILSDGVWQFNKAIQVDGKNLPYNIYINIIPFINVKPDSAIYPFNEQRKNFSEGGEKAHEKLANLIRATYGLDQYSDDVKSFGNIQYFDPDTGQLGPTIDLVPELPQDILTKLANNGVADNSDIEIGVDGRVKVNGNEVDTESVEDLQAALPKASQLIIDQSKIDASRVMVHENADLRYRDDNYDRQQVPITEFLRNIFGERMDDFYYFMGDAFQQLRGEVVNLMGPSYAALLKEAVGISVDPTYRGVSVKVPFSGMFINPLVPEAPAGPQALIGITTTMVHELAHFKARSHDAKFPAEMQRIQAALEAAKYDQGFDFGAWRDRFVRRATDEGFTDIIRVGQELFNTADIGGDFTYGGTNYQSLGIVYRGEQFKDGSPEQVPNNERSASGAAANDGILEAGRDRAERVLGPAYESRRGTGKRGKPAGGTGGGAEGVNKSEAKIADGMEAVYSAADRLTDEERSQGMLKGIGNAVKGHSLRDWIPFLSQTGVGRKFRAGGGLTFMPTDGLLDYADTIIGKAFAEPLRRVIRAVNGMTSARARYQRDLGKVTRKLEQYILKTGSNALSDIMYYARMTNINVTAFTSKMSKAQAYATDGLWSYYNNLLTDPTLLPPKKKLLKARLAKRETQIDTALDAWAKLGETSGGQAMYTELRTTFQSLYNFRRYLLEEKLKKMGLSAEAQSKLMDSYMLDQEKLTDKVNSPSKDDAHEDFPEAPLGLFHKEYFPYKRFGQYSLRIKKSKGTGKPVLRFYETMADRDADLAKEAEALGVSRNDGDMFELGNDVSMDFNQMTELSGSALFNKALNIIAGIDPGTVSEASKANLQQEMYQLYLMGSPDGARRKAFLKAKGREGFSADVLRVVGTTFDEYAADLARLEYATQIDLELASAKDVLKGSKDAAVNEAAGDFRNEITARVRMEQAPTPGGLGAKIVSAASHWAYLSFLTAPATALVNLTAIPLRVEPYLSSRYGTAAAVKAIGGWNNWYKNAPKLASTDSSGNKSYRMVSMGEGARVKGNPVYRRAFAWAQDHQLFLPLSSFTLNNAKTPASAGEGKLMSAKRKAVDVLSYAFDLSEQYTRETTFMAAFELEYNKLGGKGLSQAERETSAANAAQDAVNHTLGNYASINRPSVMKGSAAASALFQFKQYSVNQTQFLFTVVRTICRQGLPPGERAAAMRELTGVMGMTFLMAGARGLPLYGIGMMLLQALQSATDDDEDKRARMAHSPLTANSVESQFLYDWIPEHFGPMAGDVLTGGLVTKATGLDLGSRVSLDLKSLWWRSPQDAKSWGQYVTNALVANIPGASSSLNIVSAGEEFSKGEILKGLEVGVPAFFRAPLKAYRLASEGLLGQSGKIKIRREDLENSELIGAAIGFNPTKVAELQRFNRMVTTRLAGMKAERSGLLAARNNAEREFVQGTGSEQDIQSAMDDIAAFNQRTGVPQFMISNRDIANSRRGSISESRYDVQGMGLSRREAPVVQQLLDEQTSEEE